VDNYEYKQMNDYEYVTKIPNTPLSENTFNQLSNNDNNNNSSKSHEVKASSIIKEKRENDKSINYSTYNIPNIKLYNNSNYIIINYSLIYLCYKENNKLKNN